jgi:SH3-like domain-containing protein
MNYDIKHIFYLKSMPIKVTAEYENWLEIKDYEGDDGWINKNLVTKKKTAIVRTDQEFINLHKSNFSKSKVILKLENNVILTVIDCVDNWCKVKIDGYKGWVNKYEIWGWKND